MWPIWAKSGVADWVLGGWIVSAAMNFQSGFPLTPITNDNTNAFIGFNRSNLTGTDPATSGGYEDRLASADHPTRTWTNSAAFVSAPAFTFGNAPRTFTSERSPIQANVDGVFIKNIRLGTKTAQVKIEMLNLLNRVNVRANRNTFGNSNFGQIGVQAGFMRITQVMFRYSF